MRSKNAVVNWHLLKFLLNLTLDMERKCIFNYCDEFLCHYKMFSQDLKWWYSQYGQNWHIILCIWSCSRCRACQSNIQCIYLLDSYRTGSFWEYTMSLCYCFDHLEVTLLHETSFMDFWHRCITVLSCSLEDA